MPTMNLSALTVAAPDGLESIDIAEISFRHTVSASHTTIQALLSFREIEDGAVNSHVIDVPWCTEGQELDPLAEAETVLGNSGIVVIGSWYQRPGLNAVWARIGYFLPQP